MKLFYSLHSSIRRSLAFWERLLAASALAAFIYLLTRTIPVYPLYWDAVIAGAVFFLTLISPVAGYFAAVAAATYPLYDVSIYLAVIFLAVTVIGQHGLIANLNGALLALASPLLGSVYLAWAIPLLGGLWWGPAGGALMGAFAAFWGMILAGMAGLSPDWVNLYGVLPVLGYLPERFSQLDSLETLTQLFLPLMPDSTYVLYYVMQMGSWALIGWAAGMLSEKDWAQVHSPRAGMIFALIGAALLAVFQIVLSAWLKMPISPNAEFALGMTTLCSALAVMLLEFFQDYLEHPLPIPNRARALRIEMPPAPVTESNSPLPSNSPTTSQNQKNDDADDLIMLELD